MSSIVIMMTFVDSALNWLRKVTYSESDLDLSVKLTWAALVTFSVVILGVLFKPAPYGRYVSSRKTMFVSSRVAWAMESPAFLLPLALALAPQSSLASKTPNALLLALFIGHYIYRTLVYPSTLVNPSPYPLSAALAAILFTSLNGLTQGLYLTRVRCFPNDWTLDIRFILGLGLFCIGLGGNMYSDSVIQEMRRRNRLQPGKYQIPREGFFRWLVAPNYTFEILEWTGWALAVWGAPAALFALFSFFFLSTRARQHRRYYEEKFREEYVSKQKILIPFVL